MIRFMGRRMGTVGQDLIRLLRENEIECRNQRV